MSVARLRNREGEGANGTNSAGLTSLLKIYAIYHMIQPHASAGKKLKSAHPGCQHC